LTRDYRLPTMLSQPGQAAPRLIGSCGETGPGSVIHGGHARCPAMVKQRLRWNFRGPGRYGVGQSQRRQGPDLEGAGPVVGLFWQIHALWCAGRAGMAAPRAAVMAAHGGSYPREGRRAAPAVGQWRAPAATYDPERKPLAFSLADVRARGEVAGAPSVYLAGCPAGARRRILCFSLSTRLNQPSSVGMASAGARASVRSFHGVCEV